MPIDVAVVGCGHMGSFHARVVAADPRARLVAVVDVLPERARTLAERHGAEARTRVPDGVAAVVVSTPTPVHVLAAEHLAAGRWVLVEKPIAQDLVDAGALVHPRCVVGHSERFNPAVRRLGAVRPRHLRSRRALTPRAHEPADSAALDLLIHDLDLFLAWTGELAELVSVRGSWHAVSACLRTPSGATARLEATRLAERPLRRLWVQEPRSFVEVDLLLGRVSGAGHPLDPPDGRDALTAQWDAFVDAVQGAEPAVGGAAARERLRLALEIQGAVA